MEYVWYEVELYLRVVAGEKVLASKSKEAIETFRNKFVENSTVTSNYFNDPNLKSQLADEFRRFVQHGQGNMESLLKTLREAIDDLQRHKLKHLLPTDKEEAKKLKKILAGSEESGKCLLS